MLIILTVRSRIFGLILFFFMGSSSDGWGRCRFAEGGNGGLGKSDQGIGEALQYASPVDRSCGVWRGGLLGRPRDLGDAQSRGSRSAKPALERSISAADGCQRSLGAESDQPQGWNTGLGCALDNKDEKVRTAAAKALGFACSYAIRSSANTDVVKDAANGLRASLKDPIASVRTESARSIGILGGIGFAIPRRGASGGRGKMGTPGKSPVDAKMLAEVFKELAGDRDAGVRFLVWQALALGPRLGIELPQELVAGLEAEPPDNREAAIKTLTEYGKASAPALPVLVKFLKEDAAKKDRGKEAEGIVRALGRIAPGALASGEAVACLTEALESESPPMRAAALDALERIGPQKAASAMPKVRALENDPDSKVREAAKKAIKSLAAAPK